MVLYIGLRHFKYSGTIVVPGLVFQKLAVPRNLWLEQRGFVEEFRGREEELIPCPECPAKFTIHSYMQRHVDGSVHQDGRVVASQEGIRRPEQEQALDEAAARIPAEEPGFVEADHSGGMSREPKRIKRRK